MKALILAGGYGTRMREHTEFRPKPMVEIGGRPVLWHIMKNLAVHGISEFVIATGYMGSQIADYFLNFATRQMDFSMQLGDASTLRLYGEMDERDWTVTIAHTGLDTPTGGRIYGAAKHLDGEDFLVTYGDGLANVNVTELVRSHTRASVDATVTVANPPSRFGVLEVDENGLARKFLEKPQLASVVSIGFFIFRANFLDRLGPVSVLEEEPLTQLAEERQLNVFRHTGFWQPMDTSREHEILQAMWDGGSAPWKAW